MKARIRASQREASIVVRLTIPCLVALLASASISFASAATDILESKLSPLACAALLAEVQYHRARPGNVEEHLLDGPLRSVFGSDPFGKCRALWQRKGQKKGTRTFSSKQATWLYAAAADLSSDAAQVFDTFQELHDLQEALAHLRTAWATRRREARQKRRAERIRLRRQHQVRQESLPPKRKIPRRTLLSNITDYDQDLEDDFFSELIEQVRLPTFTLEEYYEDEEDDDDDKEDAGQPTTPIYSKRELLRELRGVRLARSNNIIGGTLALSDQALYDRLSAKLSIAVEHMDESEDTVWFTYSAAGPHGSPCQGLPSLRISTIAVREPQCPIEELRVTPIDEVTQKRYQRALERLWQLHPPYKDPVLESFQRVPFPHCNLGDLQVMAMDVLHKKRTHKTRRLDRYDPALRVVGCVLLQTPVCDLTNLRERPLDEVVERRLRTGASVAQAASHQSSIIAPSSRRSIIAPSSRRSSWADTLLQRRSLQEETSREEDWSSEDIVDGQDTNDAFVPSQETTLHSHESLKTTEAIVSSALRTDRATMFHPFEVSRPDTGRMWRNSGCFEPDDVREDPMDDTAKDITGLSPAESQSEPHIAIHELDATDTQVHGAVGESAKAAGVGFEYVVPRDYSHSRSSTRRRKSRNNGDTEDKPGVASPVHDVTSISGLRQEMEPSLREEQADHSLEDIDHFDDEPSSVIDHPCLELHLDVEGELHRVEAQLRDVRQELDRLKRSRVGRESSESLNARDISILRNGCDWSTVIDDFETIGGVEMLWHSFRDAGESSDDEQLLPVELELLRECNAADAFAR